MGTELESVLASSFFVVCWEEIRGEDFFIVETRCAGPYVTAQVTREDAEHTGP